MDGETESAAAIKEESSQPDDADMGAKQTNGKVLETNVTSVDDTLRADDNHVQVKERDGSSRPKSHPKKRHWEPTRGTSPEPPVLTPIEEHLPAAVENTTDDETQTTSPSLKPPRLSMAVMPKMKDSRQLGKKSSVRASSTEKEPEPEVEKDVEEKDKVETKKDGRGRGSNGWEDSLRPRPTQVDHFQSYMLQSILESEVGRIKKKKKSSKTLKERAKSKETATKSEDRNGNVDKIPAHILKELKIPVLKVRAVDYSGSVTLPSNGVQSEESEEVPSKKVLTEEDQMSAMVPTNHSSMQCLLNPEDPPSDSPTKISNGKSLEEEGTDKEKDKRTSKKRKKSSHSQGSVSKKIKGKKTKLSYLHLEEQKKKKHGTYKEKKHKKRNKKKKETEKISGPAKVGKHLKVKIVACDHRTVIQSKECPTTVNSAADPAKTVESPPDVHQRIGSIVWGKLGTMRWWPGMIVSSEDCGMDPPKSRHTWVFWFGDHKISEVEEDKLVEFSTYFKKKYSKCNFKAFKLALKEALRECAARVAPEKSKGNFADLLSWASHGFPSEKGPAVAAMFQPNPEEPIPEIVRFHLRKIKRKNLFYYQHEMVGELTGSVLGLDSQLQASEERLRTKGDVMTKIQTGALKIDEICIACTSSSAEVVGPHPLFEGGVCRKCQDGLIETLYAYDDDGAKAYCVICSCAGELLICDNEDCNSVYCVSCLEGLAGTEELAKVREANPWMCYLCSSQEITSVGHIRRREGWQQNVSAARIMHEVFDEEVLQLFQPKNQLPVSSYTSPLEYVRKKPLRVLSLSDGMGTALYVLDHLGLQVDSYYACEVDEDAVRVAAWHNGKRVEQIGVMEELTELQVQNLCPVDLVLGASPCEDLSVANPERKGLYDVSGTGRLFFEFFRVLKTVQMANNGRHLFWLYENVACMPLEYKKVITRFLGCEPAMLDARFFSPNNHQRASYFWGNIPGLHTPLQPHMLSNQVIPEVTHPVKRNGSIDAVRAVTDLEAAFGYPQNYTNVANLALTGRQRLLGKSWSVPVITHILKPLRSFFRTTGNTDGGGGDGAEKTGNGSEKGDGGLAGEDRPRSLSSPSSDVPTCAGDSKNLDDSKSLDEIKDVGGGESKCEDGE